MSPVIVRLWRRLAQALWHHNHPRQIAFAVALGVCLGVLPKDNLMAVVLATLMFSLPINLACGLGAALVFSAVGFCLDPLTDPLGRFVLETSLLQKPLARVYQLPLVPWTRLDNTVVVGGLLVGLVQFYPTYRWTRKWAEAHHIQLVDWLRQRRVGHFLPGA